MLIWFFKVRLMISFSGTASHHIQPPNIKNFIALATKHLELQSCQLNLTIICHHFVSLFLGVFKNSEISGI